MKIRRYRPVVERTIRCKLAASVENCAALQDTAKAFASACMFVLDVAKQEKIYDKRELQPIVYRDVRAKFGLTANLSIRAIARVAEAIQGAARKRKTVNEFRPTSIDYDARIFSYRERDQTVSVSTTHGRVRIPLSLGAYQREALAGKKPTCAKIVKNGKRWFIHIVVSEEAPALKGGPPLGIDLGIKKIAAISTGRMISGAKVQAVKDRYSRVRASLQSKGTRDAKRVLRRLAGRERRFIAWTNHNVSQSIVREARAGGFGTVRMEDLKGIRGRTRSWNRHLNRMMSGWSFGELQGFVSYKAERAGIGTEFVNPAWTSQDCHQCHARGIRKGEDFVCINTTCGWMGHADFNAARNIAAGGVGAGEIPAVRNATRIGDRLVDFFVRHVG